ncbi:MAG: 30S ribosomal protein S4 [Candidatus Aenigmarchaeota archaeon]|nr:30S ribosomal protein S4 [Candidatus Aenigmarchaeota archaeon]MBU5689050.1 30S ribosomal protein S4 [Candidatus Aenigmarchaeota archaeon]
MRKIRKTYSKPKRPWDKARIEEEEKIMKKYGLRRKREIWRAAALLRSFRQRARNLAALKNEEEEKKLLERLYRLGLLEKGATLNDVLSLTVEDILERRLQTIVAKKGLANTVKQARQYIVHGHIGIEGRRVKFPSFLVTRELEDKIEYYKFQPKELKVENNE